MGDPARRHRRPHRLGLDVMVTRRRRGAAAKLPAEHCAIAGANIRALRQRNGWTEAQLGKLMGWTANATVCAAEGHRGGRQRRFTTGEIQQLAVIFAVPAWQLVTPCATCGGQPPAGYACLACGAVPGPGRPGAPARESASGSTPVSTGVDGATVLVTVSACATLSAGTVHLSLTAREGPAPGNLAVQPQRRPRQPRRPRAHRREGRPPGRPEVRRRHLRRRLPARHHRTRPARAVRRRPRI